MSNEIVVVSQVLKNTWLFSYRLFSIVKQPNAVIPADCPGQASGAGTGFHFIWFKPTYTNSY